jgi:hypothetical protein
MTDTKERPAYTPEMHTRSVYLSGRREAILDCIAVVDAEFDDATRLLPTECLAHVVAELRALLEREGT